MPIARLTDAERDAALVALPGWVLREDGAALLRTFTFADFSAAFGFMARAALYAEKADHHPEWSNRYNLVDVTLTTHSAKGLTALDLDLAAALDKIAPDATILTDHGADLRCLCETRADRS